MPYTTTVNQHKTYYYDSKLSNGAQNGNPNIVMIHGLGSSQNYWMPVIAGLNNYRCVAIDSYGAGRSKSNGERLSMDEMAADVISIMDALHIPKAVIAGHSMGGTMTCVIAARYPDRVAGIVLVGPVNPSSVKPDVFTARIKTVLKDGMEPLADTVPTAATSTKSTALARAFIRELILGSDPKSYASHCQVIIDIREPDYGAIKTSTCIIAGEEDKSAPLEGCRYIHEHIASPWKEMNLLSNCGHWHCVEAPERVSAIINRFCSSL